MATIVNWDGFKFSIKKSKIIGLEDFDVSVSVETEKMTAGSENYQKKKNLDPTKITLTGIFSMALGVKDVRKTAYKLVDKCRKGDSGYIYVGKGKLMPPKFMGTSAKISKIDWLSDGRWSYAEVSITLEQCEKYGGGTDGEKAHDGGGGKSGGSKGGSKRVGTGSKQPKPKEKIKGLLTKWAEAKRQTTYGPTRYGRPEGKVASTGGGRWVAMTK